MLDTRAKVCIVGGGIVGASTAYYLTKAGHPAVVVVEAVEVAHAASGRAGGFLALDWCDGQDTQQLTRKATVKCSGLTNHFQLTRSGLIDFNLY